MDTPSTAILPIAADRSRWGLRVAAASKTRGEDICPGDVCVSNVYQFLQGKVEYVLQDVDAMFRGEGTTPMDEEYRSHVCDMLGRHRVGGAFQVRRELISFKKTFFHLFQDANSLEKELRRISALLFTPRPQETDGSEANHPALEHMEWYVPDPSEWEERYSRYMEISSALATIRGVREAVHDVRRATKDICAIPRHPDDRTRGKGAVLFSRFLDTLPGSLGVSSFLKHGTMALLKAEGGRDSARVKASDTVRAGASCGGDEGKRRRLENPEKEAKSSVPRQGGQEDAVNEHEPVVEHTRGRRRERYGRLCAEMGRNLPAPLALELQQVLVARGVAKAMTIVDLLQDLVAHWSLLVEEMGSVVKRLQVQCVKENVDGTTHACTRWAVTLQASLIVLEDAVKWCRAILERISAGGAEEPFTKKAESPVSAPLPRLFEIGDFCTEERGSAVGAHFAGVQAGLRVPSGFVVPGLLNETHSRLQDFRPWVEREVERWWPQKRLMVAGKTPCRSCGAAYKDIYVNRGLCLKCQIDARKLLRCPYRDHGPGRSYICPHKRICFACEPQSCPECRFYRLDGEGAASLVRAFRPGAVFLDWDHTFCNTRKGNRPVVGKHTLNPALARLAAASTGGGSDAILSCGDGGVKAPDTSCSSIPVVVVTRNSNVDAIRDFLGHHDLSFIEVRSVKKEGLEKVDIVCGDEYALPGCTRVFVDDDVSEHFRSARLAGENVVRVLITHQRKKGSEDDDDL